MLVRPDFCGAYDLFRSNSLSMFAIVVGVAPLRLGNIAARFCPKITLTHLAQSGAIDASKPVSHQFLLDKNLLASFGSIYIN
jgi:hypothetical protein